MIKTYVYFYTDNISNLPEYIEKARANCYNAVAVPIVNPLFYREFSDEPMKTRHINFSRPDLILKATDWYQKVISVTTDSIDCDSEDMNIRQHSEKTLLQEIAFSEHVVHQIIIKIKSSKCTNLARIVSKSTKSILIALLPIIDLKQQKSVWRQDLEEDAIAEGEDTWNWWNKFHITTDFNPRIKVALELSEDIPSHEAVQRWLGESIEYIVIPSNIFSRNKTNYPVLSKAHQKLITHFINNGAHILIKGRSDDPSVRQYAEYTTFLVEKYKVTDQMQEFEDVLQIPLQPLFDNLDSYTYEIFEKDPVKYKLYQDAIESALIDKISDSEKENKTVVLMVVGAGRGPLVRSALNASSNTGRKIKVYIIEKNPNAIITLTALVEELWPDKDITIFSKDMRDFTPPEKADILVSELLGSFGDNELSPECLDGAQKHLKQNGISIPYKSISYINPIMSPKIYNSMRQLQLDSPLISSDKNVSVNVEKPFVVYLKNVYHIARPQALFEFIHPNNKKTIDNSRFKSLRFNVTQNCVFHGLAGYFEAILYKDIIISINPETHTEGMSSWFPMYFPMESQSLKAGDILEINFWRCISTQKVWYEWSTSLPHTSRIYNHDGRSAAIYK